MQVSITREQRPLEREQDRSKFQRIHEAIDHASKLLPAQGPITVFIALNPLQAFEHLPFCEAVEKGAQLFGCQPYLSEDRYREELLKGRILFSDLQDVLEHDLGVRARDAVPCFGSRIDLRSAMLQYPLLTGPTSELIWYVAEANAMRRVRREVSSAVRERLIAETRRWVIRDLRGVNEPGLIGHATSRRRTKRQISEGLATLLDRFGESRIESWSDEDWESFTLQALWRVCVDGVRDLPNYTLPPPPVIRHRDVMLEATGVDTDALVHDQLIPFCSAFLDQGMAPWSLPRREEGFYRAYCSLYREPRRLSEAWMRGLAEELGRLEDGGIGPLESIAESLNQLGVTETEWPEYIAATLLTLRGWGGMVRQIEIRSDRAVQPVPAGSLVDFLAIRLLLDRFALKYTAHHSLGISSPVSSFWRLARGRVDGHWPPSVEQRAFAIFQLAQVYGLSPDVLYRLGPVEWQTLMKEIEGFSELERRRIFHFAYEQRFRTRTLDAVSIHAAHSGGRPSAPRFQAVFCLDDREESFRRHLEELDPKVETFGVAGFYNVAMYFRGAADAHFTPLCPIVILPQNWVTEEVATDLGKSFRRRAMTRRVLGTASLRIHTGSRTFALGAILTGAVGVLASIPLVARILFPRLTARTRKILGRIVETPPITHLRLERQEAVPGAENGHVGFSLDEMTHTAERLLRDIGLTTSFARLVLLLGHSSNSMNNPYNSAYNCGACGGGAGGPNARAMAQMLNDPRIRERLAAGGLSVPDQTIFVGGEHNTCKESVTFFDVNRIPNSHREEFQAACKTMEKTCDRNAHERCRRFMSAPLSLSFAAARLHVEGRAEDLAQTRPEYGHASTGITIVGRREWSHSLFLDRRAFLASYDPTNDDADCSILTRILQAVFPVCSGISLAYTFSNLDNIGYGSGTKLPHNLAALVGVMNGATSDLLTGLPWQGVEIHEPIRPVFIIETTPEAMTRIMDRNDGIGKLCRNEWVQLSVIDPQTHQIHEFKGGEFRVYRPQVAVLPKATSSVEWYSGWRDNLEFAEIEA